MERGKFTYVPKEWTSFTDTATFPAGYVTSGALVFSASFPDIVADNSVNWGIRNVTMEVKFKL